jgi:hypothetical protein
VLTRSAWRIGGLVLLAVAVGAGAALLLAGRFVSPRSIAASARPPKPSVLTAGVVRGELGASVNFRANVVAVGQTPVLAPAAPSGDVAVVTADNARVGSLVVPGEVLFAVALRPVFVFAGPIPAFRPMTPGDHGIDVEELQKAIESIGLSTGEDQLGDYGPGTAAAIQALYERSGYAAVDVPVTSPDGHRHITTREATVPLGEILFVPSLPRRVTMSSLRIGRTAPTSKPVVRLGSGNAVIRGEVDANAQALIRRGDRGSIVSDISGKRIGVSVLSVVPSSASPSDGQSASGATYVVTLAGTASISGLVGQNVHASVRTAKMRHSSWIVPVTAVTTSASGASFVTVVTRHGQRRVTVEPGLVSAGREAIEVVAGTLTTHDRVVTGSA